MNKNTRVMAGLLLWAAAERGVAGPMKPDDGIKGTQGGNSVAAEVRGLADDFCSGLEKWVVEQQPGGTVTAEGGVLTIDDKGGCTVWWREPLKAPVRISYRARVRGGEGRGASDLNCFWMATDPRGTGGAEGFFDVKTTGRDGRFASYDGLRTYYTGYGGNGNTTTRFRRYDGAGARPLLPGHERLDPGALLEEDREYRIEIMVTAEGRTTWSRDGETLFDFTDPEPLREGWFGFRTVWARVEVREFRVEPHLER